MKNWKKLLSGGLCAAMLMSMLPVTAFAEETDGTEEIVQVDRSVTAEDTTGTETQTDDMIIEDTETQTADIAIEAAEPDVIEDEAGAILSEEAETIQEESDRSQQQDAETETAEDETEEIEALADGTCIVDMNVSYSDFYSAVWSSSVTVDAVSSATTSKCRSAANTYYTTEATVENGTDVLGVVVPVQITQEQYETFKEITDTSAEYYITGEAYTTVPSFYLAYADGTFTVGKNRKTTVSDVEAAFTSNTTWGDYEIDLTSEAYAAADVYAASLVTTDGAVYPLRQCENLWAPSSYSKIAWSTGVKTKEPHGGQLAWKLYSSMEGKTIRDIVFYTKTGQVTLNLAETITVVPHYNGTISAEFVHGTDGYSCKITGLPEDMTGAKVTVSTGSRQKTYLVQNGTLTDGAAALSAAPAGSTTYTVVVESNEYAAMTATITTPADHYVLMNVPFSGLYSCTNHSKVDAVSSATTSKCRSVANVYYTETASIENGTDVLGVKLPVCLSAEDYETLKAITDTTAEGYIYEEYETAPSIYWTYTDGKYTYKGTSSSVNDVAATISSSTPWGDYLVALSDSTLGFAPANVYGAYLTTTDGSSYALKQAENLWTPSNFYEFAFSVGITTSEPHGGKLSGNYYKDLEGKSIASMTYITTEGMVTYNFAQSLYVAPHLEAKISGLLLSDRAQIEGIPEDLEDVTISIGTTGRGAVTLVSGAEMDEDGWVKLAENAAPAAGTDYTVTVSSSNYADITGTVELADSVIAMTNVTYNDFYSAFSKQTVDAVSSATTSKCRSTSNTFWTEEATIEGGTDILGVTVPVMMSMEDYAAICSVDDAAAEGYISEILTETPAAYMALEDGVYSWKSESDTVKDDVEATIASASTWGDYQLSLKDSSLGIAPADIYGVYLTTAKGNYPLKQGENLWNPRSYTEFAWSTGHKKTEPHGGVFTSVYPELEGQSVTSLTYITKSGLVTYNFAEALYLAPYYDGEITAELTEDGVVITGLPEDGQDMTVSVYTGSRQKTYLITEAGLIDAGADYDEDAAPVVGTSYTVQVNSSNYAAMTATVVYKQTESEITKMYETLLGREPDAKGLASWVEAAESGSKTGIQIAQGFVFSSEFKKKNLCNEHYVEALYSYFKPDSEDADEMAALVEKLDNGASRESVFNELAMSDEFAKTCEALGVEVGDPIAEPTKQGMVQKGACAVCGKLDAISEFVTRLYKECLGRTPDAKGLANWTEALRNQTKTGRQVAYGIVFSSEFKNKNLSDSDYVKTLYRAFFGREADAKGLQNWVNKLAAGATRESVFNGFVGSQEFLKLCAKYGIIAK